MLVCTQSEGHTHTDACYEQVLICEIPEHTHTDACYETEIGDEDVPLSEFLCGMEEHTHTDACYGEDGSLACTLPEHTHDESCLLQEETDFICGMEEHTHTDACYDADGNLTCTLPEHTHDESCLPQEETDFICGMEEHTHTDACYDADGNLTCTLPEHTHDESCLPEETDPNAFPEELPEGYREYTYQNEEGLSVLVYAPENAFAEDVTLYAEQLAEDSEAYAQAQADLDAAENVAEYDGMAALDVRFENAGGTEVEPDASAGPVYVKIDVEALLPEDVDESTVAVQHHAEVSDGGIFGTGIFAGTEVAVETVADASADTGEVTLTPSAVTLTEEPVPAAENALTEEDSDAQALTEETAQPAARMDVEASFAVESFSTFTITWTGRNNFQVTVHYVDTSGNEIAGYTNMPKSFSSGQWVTMTWYAETINNYQYQGAHIGSYNGTEISQLRYSNGWKYKVSGSDTEYSYHNDNNQRLHIYLVYESSSTASQLTTVDTVDHEKLGVHMYMFQYDGETSVFGPGSNSGDYWYGNGTTKEGILADTTDSQGWPTVQADIGTTSGSSFQSIFALGQLQGNALQPSNVSAKEVNKLFIQSYYDQNGDFYFNSAEYFATLANDTDDNFTVYNQLGTPNSENYFFYQRGNFMPYNTLNLNTVANYNLYADDGMLLSSNNARQGEPVYGLAQSAQYQFGMYMFANFYQPENGQVEVTSGDSVTYENMVFEFTGDDDMWVFIDGVLVLDIGGVHDSQSGYINFADGTVNWTDTPKSSVRVNNTDYAYPSSEVIWHNPGGESSTTGQPTTLKEIFTAAGKYDSTDWDGDTFLDGTSHTIQVFYMERGGGASNLKMRFNLKTIPDGTLSVKKDVENYYSGQMKDLEYTMQVTVDGEPYANAEYYFMGNESTTYTTDENGQFNLKHDQTAIFEGIEVDSVILVEEVAVPNLPDGVDLTDQYNINYEVRDTTGQLIEDEEITMPGYGSVNVTVTNTARFTRPLVLEKEFEGTDNSSAPDGFEATFTLYEVTDDGEIPLDTVKYSDFIDSRYIFWLETDKTYKVIETFEEGDNDGGTGELSHIGITVVDTDGDTSDGEVHLTTSSATSINNAETITVTNRYGEPTVDLTIIKNIYGLDAEQVAKLLEGDYRDGGLRFDVDVFKNEDFLTNSEQDEEPPSDYAGDWNEMDWTFNAGDTLDTITDGKANQNITPDSSKDSIYGQTDEAEHFTYAELSKETDESGETYYQYKVMISGIDISEYDLYRVWEMHMDVDGYQLTSDVEEYLTNSGADSLDNLLTTDSFMTATKNRGDHGGKATAFHLTQDTTVEFTNRYSQGELALTKEVTVSGVPDNTGTTEFMFEVRIPSEWADGYNTGRYPVSYSRQDVESTEVDEATQVHTDEDGLLPFTIEADTNYAVATVTLYPGETAVISLPTNITATITEPDHDGYSVNWTVNETAWVNTTGVENSVIVSITDNTDVSVTCTNTTGAVLPSTGGPGVAHILTLGAMLALGAGALLLLQQRRKEGREP